MSQDKKSEPLVLTMDAGGTNLVFSAIKADEEVVEPLSVPSEVEELEKCIKAIKDGFHEIIHRCSESPDAISFAFPGPADYLNGIIGNLPNLPAFDKNGVPLAAILEKEFNIPVFINNDGNLFTLGESYAGLLPHINGLLKEAGVERQYKNLIGVTLGTGFGGGIVINGEMLVGDNSNAGEVWLLRNKLYPQSNAEESIGVGALSKRYAHYSESTNFLQPKDIFEIAIGKREGDKQASLRAFAEMAITLGDSLANLVNIIDGLVVIGGGISAAHALFMDVVMDEMNSQFQNSSGHSFNRMISKAYNLQKPEQLKEFLSGGVTSIQHNGTGKLNYNAFPTIGVGISKLGTNKAVALGAYAIAKKALQRGADIRK